MSENRFTGYDILQHGERDNEQLDQCSIDFDPPQGVFNTLTELNPISFLRMENQGQWPSCTGNAITTCAECIGGLQAGSWAEIPQLSRRFSWENGQQKWMGRVDHRQGCTIAHVVLAAIQDGICTEQTVPYEFSRRDILTGSAYREAKQFRVQNQVEITSAGEARSFLAGGYGSIIAGVLWTRRMSQCTGRMTLRDVKEDGSRGGHAVPFVGFTPAGDFLLPNSHGAGWGNNGVAEVTPEAFEYLCSRPYTVMRGVTDLTGFSKRRSLPSWGMG